MALEALLLRSGMILMEAAILERLRRAPGVRLDPLLMHAPLIYDAAGRRRLSGLYREYIDLASAAGLPLLLCTPTWRASRDRVTAAGIDSPINRDAVRFLQELRASRADGGPEVLIGGLIGCQGDCYRPEEALSSPEAERFHAWQVAELATAGCDYLIAETLPSVVEAVGIARAMQAAPQPYLISFVIGRDGRVLDGTDLPAALATVDDSTTRPPLGYLVNCAYPTFLGAAGQPRELFRRLIGYQANASSLDHCDLDGAATLQADAVSDWGRAMIDLNRRFGVKILGGCCGTDGRHLGYLARHGARHIGSPD